MPTAAGGFDQALVGMRFGQQALSQGVDSLAVYRIDHGRTPAVPLRQPAPPAGSGGCSEGSSTGVTTAASSSARTYIPPAIAKR